MEEGAVIQRAARAAARGRRFAFDGHAGKEIIQRAARAVSFLTATRSRREPCPRVAGERFLLPSYAAAPPCPPRYVT